MSAVTAFLKKLIGDISSNSPVILTGIAVTGVVSTVVLAVKATPKALSLIDDEVYKQYFDSGSEEPFAQWLGLGSTIETDNLSERIKVRINFFKKGEILKLTWKCYIPTAAIGAVTIACIIGAHNVHLRRNAALASLYSLTETAFKDYQAKIVETIGKNKELKVRDDICEEKIKRNPTGDAEIFFTGKGETLCYDSMSGRYFKTDIDKVKRAEYSLNRTLMTDMFVTLNEFYDELGLSHIKLGEDVGWNIDKASIIITFSAQLTDKDEPCLVLNYEVVPRYR